MKYYLLIILIFLYSCATPRHPGGGIGGNLYKGGKWYEDPCGNLIYVPMNKRKSLSH